MNEKDKLPEGNNNTGKVDPSVSEFAKRKNDEALAKKKQQPYSVQPKPGTIVSKNGIIQTQL
jgi:hypothetical protein